MKINLRTIAISIAVMGVVGCKSDSQSTPAPQPTAAQNTEAPPVAEPTPAAEPPAAAEPPKTEDAPAANSGADAPTEG